MDAQQLGTFIAALRKEQDMTQAQLAEKLHVTDKAISKWERGVGIPDINNLEALAAALNISISELIQCKKTDTEAIQTGDANQLVYSTFDLVKYQKKVLLKRTIIGLLLTLSGVILIAFGIHFLIAPTISHIPISAIGGADGPTSIFLAAKISSHVPVTGIVIGCILLLLGIWNILRKKL